MKKVEFCYHSVEVSNFWIGIAIVGVVMGYNDYFKPVWQDGRCKKGV